jgi:hypothetical protein
MATDAVTAARYAVSVLAAGVLTAVLGAYFAPLGTAGSDPASDAGWTLPERRARFSEADVAKLRNSPFLGTRGQEAEAGAPRWRLAGVAREGRGWQAMVVDDASPLQVRRMSEGETLPDGSTIVDIDADGLISENQGCRRAFRLYASAPSAADCVSSKELDAPLDRSQP